MPKIEHQTVSGIARMLLDAYAKGMINIMPVMADPPVELRELSEDEITPEIIKAADATAKKDISEFINIPV